MLQELVRKLGELESNNPSVGGVFGSPSPGKKGSQSSDPTAPPGKVNPASLSSSLQRGEWVELFREQTTTDLILKRDAKRRDEQTLSARGHSAFAGLSLSRTPSQRGTDTGVNTGVSVEQVTQTQESGDQVTRAFNLAQNSLLPGMSPPQSSLSTQQASEIPATESNRTSNNLKTSVASVMSFGGPIQGSKGPAVSPSPVEGSTRYPSSTSATGANTGGGSKTQSQNPPSFGAIVGDVDPELNAQPAAQGQGGRQRGSTGGFDFNPTSRGSYWLL